MNSLTEDCSETLTQVLEVSVTVLSTAPQKYDYTAPLQLYYYYYHHYDLIIILLLFIITVCT